LKLRRQASKGSEPVPAVDTPVANGNSVVLGPRDRLVGKLFIEGDLHVAGTVEGALEASGSIEIDGGGKVSGPVTAYDRLVVGSAGSLVGDVRVKRLVIEDGATFSGNVSMGKQPVAEPKPAEPEPAPMPVVAEEPIVEPKAKPKKR
jgi:cytoskeletal protein CcmA (bactofilin family)